MNIQKLIICFLFPAFLFAESKDLTGDSKEDLRDPQVSWLGIDFKTSPETTRKTVFSVPYGPTDYVGDSKIVINKEGKMMFFKKGEKDIEGDTETKGTLLEDGFDFSIVNNLKIPEEDLNIELPQEEEITNNIIVEQVVDVLPPIVVTPIYNNFKSLSSQLKPVYLSTDYFVINGVKLKKSDEFIISESSYKFLTDYGSELDLLIDGNYSGVSGLLDTDIEISVTEEILKLYPNVSGLSLGRQISFKLSDDLMEFVLKYTGLNDDSTKYNFDVYSLDGSLLGNTFIEFPNKISLVRVESPVKSLTSRIEKTIGFDGVDRFKF